jgi:hypothetical protein
MRILSLILLVLILNGCAVRHYYNAGGDECRDIFIILFRYIDCKKGERPIELKTNEKKDITIHEDKQ